MKRVLWAAGAMLLAMTMMAGGQQAFQWKQVLNVPKGLNQPQGVKLDILGIEPGDTYAEVKGKLEALLKEAGQSTQAPPAKPQGTSAQDFMNRSLSQMSGRAQPRPPITEVNRLIRFQTPGGPIQAEFVSELHMERQLKGDAGPISELITVVLSAPSSGSQAISIRRRVSYKKPGDQPRISDIMSLLSQKLKGQPIRQIGGGRFLYDNGVQRAQEPIGCNVNVGPVDGPPGGRFNPQGLCDLSYDVSFVTGISKDHAATVEFTVNDAERAKQDFTADFAFFGDYIRTLQNQTHGPAPKL